MCPGKNVSTHGLSSIYVSAKAATENYQTDYAGIGIDENCSGSSNSLHIKIHYKCNITAVYEEIEPG